MQCDDATVAVADQLHGPLYQLLDEGDCLVGHGLVCVPTLDVGGAPVSTPVRNEHSVGLGEFGDEEVPRVAGDQPSVEEHDRVTRTGLGVMGVNSRGLDLRHGSTMLARLRKDQLSKAEQVALTVVEPRCPFT